MSNRKKVAKFLREEAKKLPPEEYQAFHKYYKMEYHQDGDQAYPVYGEIGMHKVNHSRRLRKIYQKEGVEGVSKYFEARGFKLIPKDEGKNTEITK